jgi:hypothetical protein
MARKLNAPVPRVCFTIKDSLPISSFSIAYSHES